jgi:hypothetical protein
MDNSGRTNLPELAAFAPLAHELVYYLAGGRAAFHNFQPGQPLVYRPQRNEPLDALILQPPEGDARPLVFVPSAGQNGYTAHLTQQAGEPLVVYEETRETGVYRLTAAGGRTVYYAAQADPRESDLTPCTDADRERVAQYLPMTYENEEEGLQAALPDTPPRQELWWWFFFGVVILLCGEVWLTRRIMKGRR